MTADIIDFPQQGMTREQVAQGFADQLTPPPGVSRDDMYHAAHWILGNLPDLHPELDEKAQRFAQYRMAALATLLAVSDRKAFRYAGKS